MPKDLRSFLQRLEQHAPDEFVRVEREVDPVYEIPAVVRRLQADRRDPAVLFEHVKGARTRAITNVLGSMADTDGSLLLGQSFLSRFKRWSIDNSQGVLVLE